MDTVVPLDESTPVRPDGDGDRPATARAATLPAWRAGVAGAVAAGLALAAGELAAAALDSGPSLVTAVGTEFIDRFAASLKDLAVSLFGTNDKTALVVGIVVTAVLLGAAFGLLARRRWVLAPIGISAFGFIGGWALWSDPLGETHIAIVAATVAIVVGIGSFALLWHLAGLLADPAPLTTSAASATTSPDAARSTVPADEPAPTQERPPRLGRRRFVLSAGALAAGAGAATVISRRLRSGKSIDAARRSTVLPRPSRSNAPATTQRPDDIEGISPYVTSNADFYRIDTALTTPQIRPDDWQLSVTGMVDSPFELTYDELLQLESVEATVTIACVSNEVGGGLVGNAVWQGVRLPALLERAGVQDGATQLVGRSVDGFTAGFPTSEALDGRTALIAYAMNGEPLPASHGYPARLIIAGLYGYVSATKWLTEIELTTWGAFDGYWVPRGWSKEGPIKTASRIDVPASGARLGEGPQPIAGVAWAPHRGIELVEVRIDGGDWQGTELGRAASDDTWVQWHLRWDATPGEHEVVVRATDGTGEVQTEERAAPAPNGASGWHSRRFTVA